MVYGMHISPGLMTVIFAGAGVAIVAAFIILAFAPRDPLAVDVIRYTDAQGGVEIEFVRIKLTNNSGMPLTNVIVDMGAEDIHRFPRMEPGESIFVSPDDPRRISAITVNTDEGISVTKRL